MTWSIPVCRFPCEELLAAEVDPLGQARQIYRRQEGQLLLEPAVMRSEL